MLVLSGRRHGGASHMAQIRTTLIEFGLLAVTITSAPVAAAEMSFRTATHGGTSGESWIVAEGDIVHATPDRFQRFLTAADIPRGARYEVYLHSPGGNLMAGIELGTIIRDHGFRTRVARWDERRVGKEWGSACRSRWS